MTTDRKLVAIVDDDDSLRRALERALTISGFGVESYATGDEFLESLAKRLPQCAILDFQLEDHTAQDVLQRMARIGCAIPVIVLSAYNDPTLKAQCLAAGAADYLVKPPSIDGLVAAIDRAMRRL